MKQSDAPLFDTLYNYSQKDIVSFDVPGHKQGLYTNRFNELLDNVIKMDVNSMPELDLLHKPTSIIDEAQNLMAQCYDFDKSIFLVNGTTAGILTMVYSVVKENDKIAVSRNVHKSVINAIILSGGTPVFIEPEFDEEYMIMNNITIDSLKEVHKTNNDLKALLIVNPTYFGVLSEIDEIIKYCQSNNIISLVDQAHGAHFNFFDDLKYKTKPDMVAMSTHKTLGSISQSSILLINERIINYEHILAASSIFQSTSASYLLMASLDETRRDIVTNKLHLFEHVKKHVKETREKINAIDKISCIDETYCAHNIDPFKITIKVNNLGLSGFDVYKILKKEYNIQMELAECYTVLAVVSIADNMDTLDRLVDALKDISDNNRENQPLIIKYAEHKKLEQKLSPKKAYHSRKEKIKIDDALNKMSANTIMIYPPGIPICLPGEVINQDVIDLIKFYKKETIFTISETDEDLVEVVKE